MLATSLALALLLAPAQTCDQKVTVRVAGGGTAGSMGVPRLQNIGSPVIGGPYFVIVTDGLPGASGLVAPSLTVGSLPLPGTGGALSIGAPIAVVPFLLEDDGVSPPLLPLTSVPTAFCGLDVYLQALVVDGGAEGGLALSNRLDVTFGQASGPLYSGATFVGAHAARDATLADLNGDGHLDLAICGDPLSDWGPGPRSSVAVMYGDGEGNLGEPDVLVLSLLHRYCCIESGDLNGDGMHDLVALTSNSERVDVLLSDGAGSLLEPVGLPTASSPTDLHLVDLDQDGSLDVLVVSTVDGVVELFAGDGFGSLAPGTPLVTGAGIRHLATGDVGADGDIDIVVSVLSGDIQLFESLGGLQFAPAVDLEFHDPEGGELPVGWFDLAVEDLDGNGHPDVIVASNPAWPAERDLRVRFGFAEGFGPLVQRTVGPDFQSAGRLAVLDVDSDGLKDVAMALDQRLAFFRTLASGDLLPERDLTVGDADVIAVVAGDLLGDGMDDLVLVSKWEDRVTALTELTASYFRFPTLLDFGGTESSDVVRGFFNADGLPDLALLDYTGQRLAVYLGDPQGDLDGPHFTPLVDGGWSLRSARMDANDTVDLVAGYSEDLFSHGVQVLRGSGTGAFAPGSYFATDGVVNRVALGDLDGDGDTDVAAATFGGGASPQALLYLLRNDGLGQLSLIDRIELPIHLPSLLLLEDVDQDGDLDALAGSWQMGPFGDGGGLVLCRVDAGGTVGAIEYVTQLARPKSALVADLTEDGILDLVGSDHQSGTVLLHVGVGGGTFEPGLELVDRDAEVLELADVDGDGIDDLLAVSDVLVLLRGQGGASFAPPEQLLAGNQFYRSVTVRDVDGDGAPDIVWDTGYDGVMIRRSLINE